MEVVNARQLLVYSSHEPRIRFVDLARALRAGEGGREGGGGDGEEGGKKRKGKKKKRMRGLKKVLVCVCWRERAIERARESAREREHAKECVGV
jgi:hypothetical protein